MFCLVLISLVPRAPLSFSMYTRKTGAPGHVKINEKTLVLAVKVPKFEPQGDHQNMNTRQG